MAQRSVVTLTTGPAGSGKTYVRCARFLADDWLPERDGVHYSNFPVFKDKLARYVSSRTGKSEEGYLERIQIIPADVLNTWVSGASGPWDYFTGKSLDGCHIAIDECHNFCGAKTNHKVRARWQAWLGEIRHQGATVEFLSQSPEKVAKEIHYEAGLRLSLVNSEDRRDPFFGVVMGDWYELRAAFITSEYETTVWEVERRKVDGNWVQQNKRVFVLDPLYFEFYDSFSAPVQGGHKAAGQPREFNRRSKLALLWWFIRRNIWVVIPRIALVTLLVYLCSGGSTTVLNLMLRAFEQTAANNGVSPKGIYRKPDVKATQTRPEPPPRANIDSPSAVGEQETAAENNPAVEQQPAVLAHEQPEPMAEVVSMPEEAEPAAVPERRVVLITPEWIVLSDGRMLRPGQSAGELTLSGIDWPQRRCVFTNGVESRIGEVLNENP